MDTLLPHPRTILRLKRPGDFRRIYDAGNKSVGRCMIMWVAPSTDPYTKVGVVASKRSIGNAVKRNRAKRRLRAATRLQREVLPLGTDVVLVARPKILTASWDDLVTDFTCCAEGLNPAVNSSPNQP